jgi:type II secretory pathway pseudopilin PulG
VKTERRPGSASRATFVVLVMALLVGGVVATLWFATQATADAYRLEQAKKATSALSVRVAQLRQQVDQQDSAPALGDRARQLGMVPAGDPAHLVVGPDGSVTLVGTPSVARTPPPPSTTTQPPPTTTTTPPTSTTKAASTNATTTSTPTTTTSPGG